MDWQAIYNFCTKCPHIPFEQHIFSNSNVAMQTTEIFPEIAVSQNTIIRDANIKMVTLPDPSFFLQYQILVLFLV